MAEGHILEQDLVVLTGLEGSKTTRMDDNLRIEVNSSYGRKENFAKLSWGLPALAVPLFGLGYMALGAVGLIGGVVTYALSKKAEKHTESLQATKDRFHQYTIAFNEAQAEVEEMQKLTEGASEPRIDVQMEEDYLHIGDQALQLVTQ